MSLRVQIVGLSAAYFVSGCGGAGTIGSQSGAMPNVSETSSAVAPAEKPYRGPRALANFDWGQDLVRSATAKGSGTFAYSTVHVVVRMHDAPGLQRYAQQVSTPDSPVYRRFLTPAQIADRFGASPNDYATAARYFSESGLAVAMWPQREILTVSGTRSQLETAFGTQFGTFGSGAQTFVAPIGTPHFSRSIPVVAVDLAHVPPHAYAILNGAFRGYSPQQIAQGFDYAGAWARGYTGAGITLGIVGTGPISKLDVPFMARISNSPYASVTQVNASPQPASAKNGHTGTKSTDLNGSGLTTPPAVTAPCSQANFYFPDYESCNPEDGEAQLDTEQTSTLAPRASVLFYLAFNPSECLNIYSLQPEPPKSAKPFRCYYGALPRQSLGIELIDDELQQAIADDRADILSESFGGGEPLQGSGYVNAKGTGVGQIEYASLALEGVAVFAASGDTGAYECSVSTGTGSRCVSYPSGDVNVTSVGGVNIPLNSAGQLLAEITAWGDQTTRGGIGNFANNVGSGGGVSTIVAAPPWQIGITPFGLPSSLSMRGQPDVSLDADPETGPTTVINVPFPGSTYISAAGGTSAAAPEMAAMWALVLQACKAAPKCATGGGPKPYRLGNAAPLLYKIFAGKGAMPSSSVFYDVRQGNNGAYSFGGGVFLKGYRSGKGYDLVTGIGVPYAGHLIEALTGTDIP